MKRSDINIRDPFVLLHDGTYYLYGTRSDTCWSLADGFDCYTSQDLLDFEGPFEVFHRPEGFFADREYWAPECYYFNNAFYFVTTLGAGDRKKGIYVLRSDSPTGPFVPYSGRLTPEDWTCIDGTVYFEGDTPYLIFSHSFEDVPDGDFCVMKLSPDLKSAAEEPRTLFTARQTAWAKPFPYARQEFGMEGDVYFSDGPGLLKLEDGRLYMIMSSWSVNGYAVGVAVSDSGLMEGPWRLQAEPLYPENGGHGMFFRGKDGGIIFTLHYPNDKYLERPTFWTVEARDGKLLLGSAL